MHLNFQHFILMTDHTKLFLIIILCCWLSNFFCNDKFHKKLSLKMFLLQENFKQIMIDESWYWIDISRASTFTKRTFHVFFYCKVEKYWVLIRQKNYFTCNSLKRDRVALVGLPPAALGPQDIPRQRTARPELAGVLFWYINSFENLQSFLDSTGLYISQCLLTIKYSYIDKQAFG